MQLTEIKNDLATINYSPEINRLMLSDFILIEDSNQSILAQVISIEATMEDDVNSAMLKFLLSIDKDANLTQYSGYVPAKGATLILINPQEVVQLIKGNEKNIYVGDLASYPDVPVELSLDFLRKRPYIQVDFAENKLQIVESIVRGLEKHNKKTLLFDFGGLYTGISLPTVTLGYNFKLPLNYDALCYIAEEELNDCGNDNKAIIQGILLEVQNYVKSIEDEFIPFDTLISVLDAQYDENPLPELLLLKNKLIKYQQQGLFAQEKSEFDFLDTFLKDAKNFKFDLSELPLQWHKIAFASILDLIKAKCYLITDFMDENSNKKIIKKLYEKNEIRPIVISSYNYKYQLQLKAMSKNMVLFKPIQRVNDFAGYTSFLNILSQDTFIVWGEQTLFIPLIVKLSGFYKQSMGQINKITSFNDNVLKNNKIETKETNTEEIKQDKIEDIIDDTDVIEDNITEDYELNEEIDTDEDVADEIDETIPEDIEISDNIEDTKDTEDEDLNIEDVNEPSIENQNIDIIEDTTSELTETFEDTVQEAEEVEDNIQELEKAEDIIDSIPDITDNESIDLPSSDDLDFFFDDINKTDIEVPAVEEEKKEETIDSESAMEEETVLESTDQEEAASKFEQEEENVEENVPDSTAEDIDEVIDSLEEIADSDDLFEDDTNQIDESNQADEVPITEEDEAEVIKIESDDFINMEEENDTEETINSENQQITETDTNESSQTIDEIVVPEKQIEIKSPTVPVYESKSAPQFDVKFAQGTYVYTPKYGRGVVERVINYGAKQLILIIFDENGRKLIDPNVTELKQV